MAVDFGVAEAAGTLTLVAALGLGGEVAWGRPEVFSEGRWPPFFPAVRDRGCDLGAGFFAREETTRDLESAPTGDPYL